MANLQYINTSKIYPHPDNPRKELGDLTELADSIKANGILQNLTVVPWNGTDATDEDCYTVVIGHRRLAAAKLAKVSRVPCVVLEMSPEQQLATMLLENMQRNDLTVYEQAQGFQLMLDMGETVATCAEKTGFSESTIRRRVKLLDLDQDKFKKSEKRGATLSDYIKLEEIEDLELRNEVLDAIGTKNFQNKLQQALETERRKKWLADRVNEASQFATKIETIDHETMEYVYSLHSWDKKKVIERPDDADSVEYYYRADSTGVVALYRQKQPETDAEAEERARKAERDAEQSRIYESLKEATERARGCRTAFISSFKIKKEHMTKILSFSAHAILDTGMSYGYRRNLDGGMFAELMDVEIVNDDFDTDSLDQAVIRAPEYSVLVAAYCTREDAYGYFRRTWNVETQCYEALYNPNEKLTALYDFLISIGYEMSDEEKALQDGTHELFGKAKEVGQNDQI